MRFTKWKGEKSESIFGEVAVGCGLVKIML